MHKNNVKQILSGQIETERNVLAELIKTKGIESEEVLKQSEKLDSLIYLHHCLEIDEMIAVYFNINSSSRRPVAAGLFPPCPYAIRWNRYGI